MKKTVHLIIILLASLSALAQTDQIPIGNTQPPGASFRWLNPSDTNARQLYISWGNIGGISRSDRISRYHDLLNLRSNFTTAYMHYADSLRLQLLNGSNSYYGNNLINGPTSFYNISNFYNQANFNSQVYLTGIGFLGTPETGRFLISGNDAEMKQTNDVFATNGIFYNNLPSIFSANLQSYQYASGSNDVLTVKDLGGTIPPGGFIQNNISSPQTANFWINGGGMIGNISSSLQLSQSFLSIENLDLKNVFNPGQLQFNKTTGGNQFTIEAKVNDTTQAYGDIPIKFLNKVYSDITPTEPKQVVRLQDLPGGKINGSLPKSFFQKDTLNSLKNYHLSAYTQVYNPPSVAGISFLSRLNDTTLVTVFRANALGQDAQQGQGILQMMKYNTRTHIWSAPTTIYTDGAGYDAISSGGGGVLDNGRIVVFFRRYNLTSSTNIDVGSIYSDDGGATWSTYTMLSGTSVTSTYGKVIKSGSIYLKPIYTTNKCELVSSTNGSTWTYYSTPYNYGSNPSDGSMAEPYINKIGTDSILLVSRSSAGRVWQYLSTDNGLTFNFISKLPLSTAFTSTSAISPEIVYDDVRKNVIVFTNYRSIGSSASAYTKDKLVVYAASKTAINSPTIINIVNRPDPNGRVFGGYTSTVKLTDSTFYSLVTDYHRPDTTLVNTSSATNIGMWAFNLKYSNYNSLSSYPATKGFAYLNPINGNVEWRDISQPFYINQVTKTISPADQASLELSGSTNGTFLNWLQSKGALRSGNTTGNQWDEWQTGNYSLNIGTNNVNGGSNSMVVGVNDTIAVGSIRGFAVGSGNKISATGGFVNGVNGKVTAAGASLFKDGNSTIVTNSMANSAEWNYQAGYKFYTDALKTKGFSVASTGAVSFLQSPVFTGITGLVKANGSSAATVATAGTDYIAPDIVNTATDANYTITSAFQLVKLPAITTSHTVTLPAATTNSGRTIKIWNQNTSGTFLWTFVTTVKDATNSTIATIPNQAFTLLESDGTNWIKTN